MPPATASGGAQPPQTANLDNNTGAPTRETGSELGLTNIAAGSGLYTGPVQGQTGSGPFPVQSSTSHTVTAEDLAMQKSVAPGTFVAGEIATYTLKLQVSEYVSASGIVITDLLPNGVCPVWRTQSPAVTGVLPADCGTGGKPRRLGSDRGDPVHGHRQLRRHLHPGLRAAGRCGQRHYHRHLPGPDAHRVHRRQPGRPADQLRGHLHQHRVPGGHHGHPSRRQCALADRAADGQRQLLSHPVLDAAVHRQADQAERVRGAGLPVRAGYRELHPRGTGECRRCRRVRGSRDGGPAPDR